MSALPQAGEFNAFHPFVRGVFSQWHPTPFDLEGRRFIGAEQWMMFAKALLFGDEDRASSILGTDNPSEQKRLGQHVSGFDEEVWTRWKLEIVYRGNLAKFEQNRGAGRQLQASHPAMLVEANPRDWVWGVGLSVDDPRASDPREWKGENLLGRILTKVRQDIA